jgi:drug/metabolite transporter (DMT)-like permease
VLKRRSLRIKTLAGMPPRAPLTPLLLLLLSTLWGASYSLIRISVATLPPLTAMAVRTSVAAALLLALMAGRALRLPRQAAVWRRLAFQAVLNSVLPFTLLAWAQQEVEASVAAILNSCAPLMTFLWLARTGREPAGARKSLGVLVGLAGTALVLGVDALHGVPQRFASEAAILLATACYAAAAVHGRNFDALPPIVPAAGSLACAALVLVPAALVVDRPWTLSPSFASVGALLALAVFCTALALVLYFHLLATLGSVGTSAQAYLRVPIGVAIGVMFLGERLAPFAWLGLAGVVRGVAAMTLPPRRQGPR